MALGLFAVLAWKHAAARRVGRVRARERGSRRLRLLAAHQLNSPGDEIVPFSHARSLFDAAAEPKELLETGGGHNDGGLLQRPEWRARVGEWARTVLEGARKDG